MGSLGLLRDGSAGNAAKSRAVDQMRDERCHGYFHPADLRAEETTTDHRHHRDLQSEPQDHAGKRALDPWSSGKKTKEDEHVYEREHHRAGKEMHHHAHEPTRAR